MPSGATIFTADSPVMERASVSLADLDTVDLVTGSPGGDQGLWIVAGDWPAEREAPDYTPLMIKLARVLPYARRLAARSTTVLHSTRGPPVSGPEVPPE